MKIHPSEKNVCRALQYLLKHGNVKVTNTTLDNKLWFHPEFPSLSSMCDVLDELKVPNMSTQLTPEQLGSIPLPAIAFLNIDGGIMAPIQSVSNGEVEWFHTQYGLQRESLNRFSLKWSGVTLLIEPDKYSGELGYLEKRKAEIMSRLKIPFLLLAFVTGIVSMTLYLQVSIPLGFRTIIYALLGSKIIGGAISGMLVWYSLDSTNSFLRNICQINSKTNCGNLLESKAAKLFGFINWSEIGLIYFLGTFFTLIISIFTGHSIQVIQYLIILNILALPYIAYSIYYQGVVAKQWCILCLLVQLLLLSEFVVGFKYEVFSHLTYSNEIPSIFITSFSLLIFCWLLIKPGLVNYIKIEPLQRSFQRLKFDTNYVNSLFDKQKYLPPFFKGMKVGHIGNPDAANTLIMITNPTCEACARIHKEVLEFIEHTRDIQCHIIFAASSAVDDPSGRVARLILSLPDEDIPGALHRWFSMRHRGIEKWVLTLDGVPDTNISNEQLMRHIRWVELAGVNTTPYLFLNGIEFPRIYSIGEIEKLCRLFQLSRI